MIFNMCQKYASAYASLSDLRTAAICVTAYAGFLRFNELAYLRCCDVKFCNDKYVELFIAKSKTDIYRNGNVVILAKTGHTTCPFSLLSRHVQAAGIDLSSNLKFFRTLHFVRSLRSTGISYTLAREIVLYAFSQLGFPAKFFGLVSIVLDQEALLPLQTQVLATGYLSAMVVGDQTKLRMVMLRIT